MTKRRDLAFFAGGTVFAIAVVSFVASFRALSSRHRSGTTRGSDPGRSNATMPRSAPPVASAPELRPDDNEEDPPLHIIVTTDCRRYQHWQAVALEHTWARLKHPGRFTRIVSGCADAAARRAVNGTAFSPSSSSGPGGTPRWGVFFTAPGAVRDGPGKALRDRAKRPSAVVRWLAAHPSLPDDVLVVILDPDMLLLRPVAPTRALRALGVGRAPGVVGAQRWPLGRAPDPRKGVAASWHAWRSVVCPRKCAHLSRADITERYSSGPPWLVRAGDLRALAPLWEAHTRASYNASRAVGNTVYVEQLAFSSAAAQAGFAQHVVPDLQASWPRRRLPPPPRPGGPPVVEAWDLRDRWRDGGRTLDAGAAAVFHYHQWWGLGPLRFHKGHVPGLHGPAHEYILGCAAPLLLEPPPPPPAANVSRAPYSGWAMRFALGTINAAAVAYRHTHCAPGTVDETQRDVLMVRPRHEWNFDDDRASAGDAELHTGVRRIYANRTLWRGRHSVRLAGGKGPPARETFPYYVRLPAADKAWVEGFIRRRGW